MRYKSIKVRLYPTRKQIAMLDRHLSAARWAYNLCLEYKKTLWDDHKVSVSGYEMQKELFQIRKESEWLSKCKAESIRDAALKVENSYKNFFKGNGYPKFKSKKGEQSFHAYQAIYSENGRIKFYGHKIKYRDSQERVELLENSKIKQITFKRDSCGDYWATCLIEVSDIDPMPSTEKVTGIDLGLKDLVITSDGVKYENKKYLRNTHYKLRRLQRRFAKTKKGGKNREKLRKSIAKVHRKAYRQKEWYYHQITNELVRDNQVLVVETLRIKNMMKNGNLARSISDASWGMLTNMLEYKCKWHGRELIKVDTFYPSSKTCSGCGNVKKELKLSEREYICECCGLVIDRDINAAINLRNSGLKTSVVPVEDTDNGRAYEAGSKNFKKEGVQF